MAGTITKLEIQKRNKERVNVYLDGQYAFPVKLTVALELKKGQQLSDAEIERLQQQDDRHKAYDKAIYYLGFRARSRTEMERYLRKKEFTPEVIAETIERLQEEEYLDDHAFAESWANDRQQLKPKGRRALRYELRQKGVSSAAIEAALEDLDEDDAAWRALEKKLRQWRNLDEERFKRKAYGFLSRRGFNYEVTRSTVEKGWEQVTIQANPRD